MSDLAIQGLLANRLSLAEDKPAISGPGEAGDGFAGMIGKLLRETNHAQNQAQDMAAALAREEADVVETAVAMNKADMSLRLAVEVRNRVMGAWQEITRSGGG
jgi:flagellar hook-basal body complex protein FliE